MFVVAGTTPAPVYPVHIDSAFQFPVAVALQVAKLARFDADIEMTKRDLSRKHGLVF
jgi:hypothetical protein